MTRITLPITWLAVAAAAALVLLAARPAVAVDSARCERLYTKGLAELHADRVPQAIALMEEAVEADPSDLHARYYRAVSYGRAARFEEAVADLRLVVAGNAAIENADLELGYALFKLGRHEEAAAPLQRARLHPVTAERAAVLYGMNELRRGRHAEARQGLSAAEASPTARYYRGLAAYRAGDKAAAEADFAYVVQNAPDSEIGRQARVFLEQIGETDAVVFRLHGGAAMEYDSNVALAPDDDFIASLYGVSDEDDFRTVITAGAAYSPYVTSRTHLSFAYDFLQSLHFDLDEFDVQTHKAQGQLALFRGPATIGLTGQYEFSLLDFESLAHGITAFPWIRFEEEGLGRTELYYRMRYRDFVHDDFDPLRDNVNHAPGIRQILDLGAPGRVLMFGYRFDFEDATAGIGRRFEYLGHQVEAGVEWPLTDAMTASAMYAFKVKDYDDASRGRDDEEHHVITRVEHRLNRFLWLAGSYVFRGNYSDKANFEYYRHIVSLGLEARY
ncbi:MAG TPA: tetratricopeptide repeat protein [Candidatus Limnocylindrales bacterium]|nr:tetratricopeptide repeat protein [Candidatus Limnocylindrales bacterium]